MATVSWVFGAGGFRVQVGSIAFVNESELNSNLSTEDITISFNRIDNGAPVESGTTTDEHGNTTSVDIRPIAVRAVVCFEGDGHLDANWIVTCDGVSGKGTGKGIGKTTTG